MSSPTQRTLAFLRENLWNVCVVERWLKYGARQDAYGFGDLLIHREVPQDAIGADLRATHPLISPTTCGIGLVQVSSHTGMAEHCRHMLDNPSVRPYVISWLRANGLVFVVGWRKLAVGTLIKRRKKGQRQRRKKHWTPDIRQITLDAAGDPSVRVL